MNKRTLYVTDLDGTLLNTRSRVNADSIRIISELIKQGMMFTYATARSLTSSSVVTEGLPVSIPVAVYNGALIVHPQTGEIISSLAFSKEEAEFARGILEENDISPLVYSYVEQVERVSWNKARENQGIRNYLSLRKKDKRFRPLKDQEGLYDGEAFYYTCYGEKEELLPIYNIFSKIDGFRCILQQELYQSEYMCEIMPQRATKAEAIKRLKELSESDRIVSFGDAINDIPMFEISDECYAVENAVQELKSIATGIIESNDSDGVAKWLLQNYCCVR